MRDATHAFVVPGEDSIIDAINPKTGKSWICGENLEQVRARYPEAVIISLDDFCAQKAARQTAPVTWKEVTQESYDWSFECIFPTRMATTGFLVGEPYDHHATSGQPRFIAFIKRGGKFYKSSRPVTITESKELF